MNVFAKFDEIPSMILQDIKETKRPDGHLDGQRDNGRGGGWFLVELEYIKLKAKFYDHRTINSVGEDF